MSRFQYQSPPIHEVILSLRFHEDLDEQQLERLPQVVGTRLAKSERLHRAEAEIKLGPTGETILSSSSRRFEGWLFKNDDASRILRVAQSDVSYHGVRPGKWPVGPYSGWRIISEEWFGLLKLLASPYQVSPVRRAGLRYLNRIAIPEDADPGQWFNLFLRAPSFLRGPYAFNISQTWAHTESREDLSATIRFTKITIEDPQYAKGNQGVLLDIEVFNLFIKDAPRYEQLAEWFQDAHSVENDIFEDCITDSLRERFERT